MSKISKYAWAAVAVAAVALGARWWIGGDDIAALKSALGGKPAQTAAAKAKPVCAFPVSPGIAPPIDCEPPGLPPDPGEKGKATIAGICNGQPCTDPSVLRDDVKRLIISEWGHSQLAVQRLTITAQQLQRSVFYGDILGKDETRKQFVDKIIQESACAFSLETKETRETGARNRVQEQVLNTDDRRKRASDFGYMFHGALMPAFKGTDSEACGFDVAAMARAEGVETIASKLLAESIEFNKVEEQGAQK